MNAKWRNKNYEKSRLMPQARSLFAQKRGQAQPWQKTSFDAQIVSRALALAMIGGLFSPALAQENPDNFTLPEGQPSPTPSPAPQGPEDDRSGVPIAPRLIDPDRAPPPPVEEIDPTQTPAPNSAPPDPLPTSDPATPQPSSLEDAFSEFLPIEGLEEAGAPDAEATLGEDEVSPRPAVRSPRPAARSPATVDADAPAIEGERTDLELGPTDDRTSELPPPPGAQGGGFLGAFLEYWIWAAIALGLGAFGGLVWIISRARRGEVDEDVSDLTLDARDELRSSSERGVSNPSGRDADSPAPSDGLHIETFKATLHAERFLRPESRTQPERPVSRAATPEVPQHNGEPLPLSVSLSIVSARRSVMMFTIEYRLTLANRSDEALRNLTISSWLDCAQSGQSEAPSNSHARSTDHIERIGPRQSQALTGKLEMPVGDIRLIHQASVPVFIPLLQVAVESAGAPPCINRFVLGTPSAINQARLQPLVFEARIGGIPGLRADKIQPFVAPKSVESSVG